MQLKLRHSLYSALTEISPAKNIKIIVHVFRQYLPRNIIIIIFKLVLINTINYTKRNVPFPIATSGSKLISSFQSCLLPYSFLFAQQIYN